MNCTQCKRPIKRAFEMMEDVPGVGPEKRFICFQCVSVFGEEEMRLHRKAICPTCGTESVKVSVSRENAFEFSCLQGHSWIL